jgi:hypothetical protein
MQAFSAAGQQFYQAQAAQASPEGAAAGEGAAEGAETAGAGARAGQEDVVEADYEIVDDK